MLALPLTVTLGSDEHGGDATFHVETHDIETWGPDEWQGHPVRLTGAGRTYELGRLKDPDDTSGRVERFRLSIGKTKLEPRPERRGKEAYGKSTTRRSSPEQHLMPTLPSEWSRSRISVTPQWKAPTSAHRPTIETKTSISKRMCE